MNKKAFTMTELIVIIIIIGVILIFALPNVTSTLERNKKDVMINDAKDFVEKVKNCLLTNKSLCQYPTTTGNSGAKTFYLNVIDEREDIKESPFGNEYIRGGSFVTVTLVNSGGIKSYKFQITLTDNEYKIENRTITELNSDNKYTYVERN